ncbi:MAG: hypothetical protein II997_09100 [Clostridia bacterium]|nr:hypothetical protein [Clostridia bacterium]
MKNFKKLLGIVLSVALFVSVTPLTFAEETSLNVTQYSDLGLNTATLLYDLNVDDETFEKATKNPDGTVNEVLLPDIDYSKRNFGKAAVSCRGFNSGTDSSNYKRLKLAVSSFDGDNMVVKLNGGDALSGETTIAAANVSRGFSVGGGKTNGGTSANSYEFKTKASNLQVWEIKAKFSNVNDGEYRLFNTSFNTTMTGGNNGDISIYTAAVGIKNGNVFIHPAGTSLSNSYLNKTENMTDMVVTGLENNTWYTFVRVVQFVDGEKATGVKDTASDTGHYEGKLYVFDESGNCLGGHDDMRDIARYQGNKISSHGFTVKGLTEGNYAMFDDYKAYNLAAPTVTTTVDSVAPTEGAITVSAAKPAISFATSFDASNATPTITLKDGANDVPVNIVKAAGGITVTPKENLYPGVTYSLSVSGLQNGLGISAKAVNLSLTKEADKLAAGVAGFVGSDGVAPVTQLTEGTVLKASVTLTNNDATTRSAVALLTLYDGNKLIGVKALSFDSIANDGTPVTLTTEAITVPALSGTAKAYITVWSDWTNKIPLKAVTVLGE